MNEKDFIAELTELMDTEAELVMDTVLDDVEEWDSLSYIAFLAMASRVAPRQIMPDEVKAAKTVRDLYKLIIGA